MILFHLHEYQYLLYFNKKYSWQHFRQKSGVAPGTYSETFAEKIYSSVFVYSIDLNEEYRTYYQDEYENINKFLFWRHGVSEEIISQLPLENVGYLTIANLPWRIDEDDIFEKSITELFKKLEE